MLVVPCSKAYLIFDTSFSREKREVYEKEEEEEEDEEEV